MELETLNISEVGLKKCAKSSTRNKKKPFSTKAKYF